MQGWPSSMHSKHVGTSMISRPGTPYIQETIFLAHPDLDSRRYLDQ